MRRALLAPLLVLLLGVAACGGDDGETGTTMAEPSTSEATSSTTTASTTTSSTSTTEAAPPTTEPGTTGTTGQGSAPTLPPDDRPRTPPADALAELAAVAAQPDFDALAAEVVAALEARYPTEEGSTQSTATSSAWSGTAGTVLFRVDGLADDSLAGWDYTVEASESGGAWAVASATKQAICRRGVSGDLCL